MDKPRCRQPNRFKRLIALLRRRCELTVRNGKGGKDRVTLLPVRLAAPLLTHLERVRVQHNADLRGGGGTVELPDALGRKYPGAASAWAWQRMFPATRLYTNPSTGERRRHHLHESVMQRAFKDALRASGVDRPSAGRMCYPIMRVVY